MTAYQSVLIQARGASQIRLIVPAAETSGDPVEEAISVVKNLAKLPVSQWIVSVHETPDVSDVEIKSEQ
jgi:hypothetical protein